MFLKSPALKEFLKRHKSKSLAEIHTSFCNFDRFTAIIAKQRALAYPQGRDFNGVLFEYENRAEFKV